jgi:sodium transport system ATP-binding protein
MIETANLQKRFGEIVAVDGVSFRAPDGAVTGLLGPNGAGKTTTLRMIYGLLPPDAGSIRVDEFDVAADPLGAQSRLGVLPDSQGLYPRLTSREHARYFGRLHGLNGSQLDDRINELIVQLGMESIADRRVDGFSHGERTKVSLLRSLVHGPQNVLLDEPTNGLDVASTRAVRALIRRLRQEGKCVLFSSHIMQEVSALCDTIVIIGQGRVVAHGSPDDIRRQAGQESLEDAFVSLVGLDTAPQSGGVA